MAQPRRNRLANETSPYLLQHADNPVDWYPWGDEAFARARTEDKPVLLSVGYSSCHWCHVMAHESFEDETMAARMNEWFVCVKVDREERPDVDSVYMTVVQAMTGSGGWPMTVFLTPDGEPFYAGTYFPPQDLRGRPGFARVLVAINTAWTTERDRILEVSGNIAGQLRNAALRAPQGDGTIDDAMPAAAVDYFREAFDTQYGGFADAPKFPSPTSLEFLLAFHARRVAEGRPDPGALYLVTETLRHMATGGIYDQLGGGFARYSVDGMWIVPHFEKMLYDNAQLVRVYLHAWQLTGNPLFERVVRETLAYLEREMLDPGGGFYSAQDADSEGLEGKYYVWTLDEVRDVLGEDDARLFARAFPMTEGGNFYDPHHMELEGRNVLTRRYRSEVPAEFGMTAAEFEVRIEELRPRLLEARSKRVPPGLDDKVLTSWNGLVLAAFAEAGRVLAEPRYVDIARANAGFVRDHVVVDGRLLHTWKDGKARIDGMLEDYTYYGLGLVELYKSTGDYAWLDWARDLLEVVLADFRDAERGGFFETPRSGERLLFDQKSFFDAATPSGNGSAAQLAWWLGRHFGRSEWEAMVPDVVAQVRQNLSEVPNGFGAIWQAIELVLAPRHELVIVGDPSARGPLERQARQHYIPWLALMPGVEGTPLPHFADRGAGGAALAYYCEDMACQLPTGDPSALGSQLPVTRA